jgi:hypothetical protein
MAAATTSSRCRAAPFERRRDLQQECFLSRQGTERQHGARKAELEAGAKAFNAIKFEIMKPGEGSR